MKQVRLGRKEQRKVQNAEASQRPPSSDPTFTAKARGRTDPDTLLAGVRAGYDDLKMLASDLHRLMYGGGIAESDWPFRLYDPALTDIRTLPPAILDDKEMLPPVEFLPQTKDALVTWLERLMLQNGREDDLEPLIEGWAGAMSPGRALKQHVDDLWQLRGKDQALYDGLVGGRLRPAIGRLHDVEISARTPLRTTLIRQSLIWCARDVQMVFVRVGKKVDFGHLATTGSLMPSPEGVLNQLRDRRTALTTALDLFFGTDEWRRRDVEPPPLIARTDLRRHPNKLIRQHAKRFQKQLDCHELDWIKGDLAATLMKQIAAILREGDDVMLARTAQPRTTNQEPKNSSANGTTSRRH